MQPIDYHDFIMVTVSRRDRYESLHATAFNILSNVKNLTWHIDIMNNIDSMSSVAYNYSLINELADKTNNSVFIHEVDNALSVAQAKIGWINKYAGWANKWLMSVDDDFIFPVSSLDHIRQSLFKIIAPMDRIFLYSVVDIYNARKHGDYIGDRVTKAEVRKIAKEHGDGVLSHLRVRMDRPDDRYIVHEFDLVPNDLMEVSVGGAGFIVYGKAVNKDSIHSMMNFPKGVRGHDIQFCNYYKNKYLILDSEAWHTGILEPYYNKYWEHYGTEAQEIYTKT